jgi:Vacuolar protein sorting-associated protein 62
VLCVSGAGYRAALFNLGALTRLNELGLLAGTETVCAVAGGSILGALLATRVPWPLYGAFREWPEQVAEPLREICSRRPRRSLLRPVAGIGGAAQAERYARELAGWRGREAPQRPRFVFGAAGLELGQMGAGQGEEREPRLEWELALGPGPEPNDDPLVATIAAIPAGLSPLSEGERAVLENHGYRLADAALRGAGPPLAAVEPLPPPPPHPRWANEARVRESLIRGRQRGGLPRLRARRSGGDPAPVPEEAGALLRRHRPFVQHDSLECYRPEPVATIAELAVGSRGNTLHRRNGELLASVLPLEGAARLDLDFLGGPAYSDGRPAREDDYLDEAGGSHAGALAARRGARREEVVYGRAAMSGGRLWLQYWFFYYYNDKGFLKVGRHEGDWEMVQLRVGEEGAPDAATYGRHTGGERASWEEIERLAAEEGEAPVVYCARGSHAALLRPGTQPAPVAPDHNDGLGPRSRPQLIELGEELPGWARWPGRWGSTRRREAFEGDSPHGPAQQRRWRRPAEFHEEAAPAGEAPRWQEPPPPTPRFEARREGNHAILSYRFGEPLANQAEPARILAATSGGKRDPGGVVHSFGVDGRSGVCALALPEGAPLRAVRACVASPLGAPGATVTVPAAS